MSDPSEAPAPPRRWSRRGFLGSAGLAAGALVAAKSWYWEPRDVRVEELVLPLAKLPPGRELRIVQLSDLHLDRLTGYFERVAALANDLQPDLLLLTGDYLEQARNLKGVRKFLELLKARHGGYAVQGNWEYWARLEGENLRRQFARAEVGLLINERVDLDIQDTPLSILGLDYPSTADNLTALQQHIDPRRVNLLLSHVPAFNHEALGSAVDLILCGHTHGGQVRLPLLPPVYLPRYSGRFISGLFRVGPAATPLYVTRGIGTSVLPVRFLCPPEITLLRLVAA